MDNILSLRASKWHYQALVLLQVCAAAVCAFVFGSTGVKPRIKVEFH